ncbi:epsin-3 [Gastrolobium bilobum]|uniref:epsin-3 n=1 Tax=Gastrolobium bilobum TaxID=150636 RepID=UPI002AB0C442|nr:epsin-3 [Gastrolobium bilobum]
MGSIFLDQIKKQTTNFLQEKYKSARITFTDVTEAEMLAEEATNKDDCSPDAKTMTRIAEASFDVEEYWRIVDVLHGRLYNINWEQWRQSYKALVLLEFMLTHGPEEFAREFQCDAEIIEELGSFTHIDERGFNWGSRMQKLSEQILKLLEGGEALREARLKALKITNEIQGFGSSLNSPSSSSSPCSSSSEASQGSSSFSSFSTRSTPVYYIDSNDQKVNHGDKNHIWDGPAGGEKDVLIVSDEDEDMEKPKGFVSGICSKIIGSGTIGGSREQIEFRCISDVGSKRTKKKFDRQHSFWF